MTDAALWLRQWSRLIARGLYVVDLEVLEWRSLGRDEVSLRLVRSRSIREVSLGLRSLLWLRRAKQKRKRISTKAKWWTCASSKLEQRVQVIFYEDKWILTLPVRGVREKLSPFNVEFLKSFRRSVLLNDGVQELTYDLGSSNDLINLDRGD